MEAAEQRSAASLATKPNIGFAVVIVVFLATAWLTYRTADRFSESNEWVTHTYEVLAKIDQLQEDLLNIETGTRGYVVTGDENFLEPYRAALARIPEHLTQLKQLTSDNPRQQRRIEDIRPLAAAKLDLVAQIIQLRKEKGFDEARQMTATDKNRRVMEEFRKVTGDMESEERGLLAERQKETIASISNALAITVGGAAIAVIVVLVVAVTFNLMTRRLQSLLSALMSTASSLASASSEILAATTQQASSAQEQTSAVAETVTTVDQVRQTSEQAAERAKMVADSAQRAAEIGKVGRITVEESVAAMASLKDQTESIAESILALAERAQAIGEIIASVNDLADQTNLLALNAGIEASRAGEHGAGFTVVAREIKDLSDQAKKATAQIRQILGEIQKATHSAVMVTEDGSKSVNATIKAVNKAGETIRELAGTVDAAATAATQITASAIQQATGMSQVQQAMRDISQATTQTAASTKQAEKAAQDVNALGMELRRLLAA